VISGWPRGAIREIDELVREIPVEIVDDAVGLSRLSIHVDNEIGAHGRPKHQPTVFGHIRFAWLTVVSDDHGSVAFEAKPNDPGERRVDNPKPHPFPGLHAYAVGNSSIDRDCIADTTGHSGFHAIAETSSDASVVVQPPILDEPQEVTIDGNRFALIDDERARQPAPKLLQRVGCG
jgi:hypothetical protein